MKALLLPVFAIVFLFAASTVESYGQDKKMASGLSQYYPGGESAMLQFIEDNTNYPIMAKKNRIQGTVIVDVKLDENGVVKYAASTILTNGDRPRGGLGAEAVRVVNLLEFESPGYPVQGQIPVRFKL